MSRKGDQDFDSFINLELIEPPKALSSKILSSVRRDLKPSHKITFIKLLLIQSFVGILTLLYCPQFEFSLTSNHSLFHFFHRNFGAHVCMALCGGIFLGSGGVVAAFLLTKAEVLKINKSKGLYYFSLSSMFLTIFLLLGAEVYLEIAFFWTLGAMIFGALAFNFSWLLRVRVLRLT